LKAVSLTVSLITDPGFYAVALPAVIFVGMAKGGFGGAMALLGVPLMALVMPPFQAAAIMLPILIVMDMVSLWAWRGRHDLVTLKLMLPAAMIGIGIGWWIARSVTPDMVRLMVGVLALLFVARYIQSRLARRVEPRGHNAILGAVFGGLAGFTSFLVHAGGPPYQVYTLPLKQDPKIFTGTSVIFFAVVNAVKLIPYFALGQFDASNLSASVVMLPVAVVSTLAGAWIVTKLKPEIFYPLMYAMMAIVGVKLVWDGAMGMLGG
jgi:uncharacterized membrane protein YfcA